MPYVKRSETERARAFYAKIDTNGPTMPGMATQCHVWTAYRLPRGYGRFETGLAHRAAWELAMGPIPEGKCILHRCDNPSCVRVDHLWAGTQAENVLDMYEKNRSNDVALKGEDNGFSKLTNERVSKIRAIYANGGTSYAKLARMFGVGESQIGRIIRRESWK